VDLDKLYTSKNGQHKNLATQKIPDKMKIICWWIKTANACSW